MPQVGPPTAPGDVIATVEAATTEAFSLCCRRHVLAPFGMIDSFVAVNRSRKTKPTARSTAADLARLLSAIGSAPASASRADDLTRLARDLGFVALGDGTSILELADSFDPGTTGVLVRWSPVTGHGIVVVTRGGEDRGRAARRIADLGMGLDPGVGHGPRQIGTLADHGVN